MALIDDHSRKVWLYIIKTKDQVMEKFKVWKALVENQSGRKLKALRIDNGLEFCNRKFETFRQKHGILRHKTVRFTPQQNGLVERMNKDFSRQNKMHAYKFKSSKVLLGRSSE